MRSRHVIATFAVLVMGFGIKMFFFSSPTAEARLEAGATQMHADAVMDIRALEAKLDIKALPVQNILSEADPDLEDNGPSTKRPL